MKKYVFTATALVSIALIAIAALAFQQEEDTDRREMIKERVGDLKMELLISRMEFEEATAEKIIEINEKYFDLVSEKTTERKEAMTALEELYRQDEVNEKEVDSLVDDLFDIEEEVMNLRSKEYKEISSLLTTEEFGRYLIFNERFHREIRKVIMEKAHDMPEGGPGGGFGPPEDGFGPPPDGEHGPPEGGPGAGANRDDDMSLEHLYDDMLM
jgi:Spy/CpxP family protein refolding chaperone